MLRQKKIWTHKCTVHYIIIFWNDEKYQMQYENCLNTKIAKMASKNLSNTNQNFDQYFRFIAKKVVWKCGSGSNFWFRTRVQNGQNLVRQWRKHICLQVFHEAGTCCFLSLFSINTTMTFFYHFPEKEWIAYIGWIFFIFWASSLIYLTHIYAMDTLLQLYAKLGKAREGLKETEPWGNTISRWFVYIWYPGVYLHFLVLVGCVVSAFCMDFSTLPLFYYYAVTVE